MCYFVTVQDDDTYVFSTQGHKMILKCHIHFKMFHPSLKAIYIYIIIQIVCHSFTKYGVVMNTFSIDKSWCLRVALGTVILLVYVGECRVFIPIIYIIIMQVLYIVYPFVQWLK